MGVGLGPTLAELISVVQLRCRISGLFCAFAEQLLCLLLCSLEEKVS